MIRHIIKLSEAKGGRYDPHQFRQERVDTIRKIVATSNYCKLKDVVSNVKQIVTELSPMDIYIGLENIESNTGDYIPTKEKETISSAAIFNKGDILFPKLRPYLNKVYRAEFAGKCSTEFHVFQAKNIHPDFLVIILRSNLILNQTKYLMTGNTLPRLQTSDVENLIIPLPCHEIQQQIVDLYNAAIKEKQTKEQEANKLLASIDDYLLKELGIELPENIENKRYFEVNVLDLIGGRLDAPFLNDRFISLTNSIKSIPHKPLYRLAIFTSESWNQNDYFMDTFPYIEINAINIQYGSISEISNVEINNAPSRAKKIVRNNDIIISTTRPNRGAISLVQITNDVTIASTGFTVIRNIHDDILREYLFIILRHRISLLQMEQRSSGGNYPAITENELKKILIPLPPIKKQKEIFIHFQSITEKAKLMQKEAREGLEKTKHEIEERVEGKNNNRY